ncbi:hypothetical protein [Streptosporangium sp. NBC_01469]|uniref:hypothetical protein n=1 Tax=Streptosporangium sp. NBC_01469 TaxID=2903898 RepID=UPI002E2A05CA|nr:hypothetical protein [Streptosporangium sp. NBC_01469]
MRRILFLLAFIVPLLALGAPARAGGWALTVMDPVPATSPDTTYTLGFWLLQHGTHPYEGSDLGEVALEFTDGKRSLRFPGVALKEPAHYAAAVSLPKGTWEVKGIQGWFEPYRIGTLTVPGQLRVAPAPREFRQMIANQSPQEHWGVIRPPSVPLGDVTPGVPPSRAATPTPVATPAAALAGGSPGETTTVAIVEQRSWWRPSYVVTALLGVAALAALAYRVRRR